MDLSLLPTPVSEYSSPHTGMRFTVRSASSPSYILTRRPGVRRPKALSEEGKGGGAEAKGIREEETQRIPFTQSLTDMNDEEFRNQVKTRIYNDNKGASDLKSSSQSCHNGAVGSLILKSSGDESGILKSVVGGRGRTAIRSVDTSSRSKSLDWRRGAPSPEQNSTTGLSAFLYSKEGVMYKRARSLERRRMMDTMEGAEGKVMSRVKSYNSAGAGSLCGDSLMGTSQEGLKLDSVTQTIKRPEGGQSLPSRLRPNRISSSSHGFRETASSLGPQSGQSIWERIEKLYGSTGSGKTEDSHKAKRLSAPIGDWPLSEVGSKGIVASRRKSITDSAFVSPSSSPFSSPTAEWRSAFNESQAGGTFPRYFSNIGKNSPSSSLQSGQTTTCTTQTDAMNLTPSANRVFSVSSVTAMPKERAAGVEWQGPTQGRYTTERKVQQGRGAMAMGTMSLDRARSKFTVAAQIRSARAAGTVHATQTQPCSLAEEGTSDPFKHSPEQRGETASTEQEKLVTSDGKRSDGLDNISQKVRGGIGGDEGIAEGKRKDESTAKITTLIEGLFESSTQRTGVHATERKKLVVPSAASVRNKIHQYEALTIQAQGSTALKHRRAFSVPEQLSAAAEELKKSGSSQAFGGLRERWDGLRRVGEEGSRNREDVTGSRERPENVVSDKSLNTEVDLGEEEKTTQRRSNVRSSSVDEVGLRLLNVSRMGCDYVGPENEGKVDVDSSTSHDPNFGINSRLKDLQELPVDGRASRQTRNNFYIDETDFLKVTSPDRPSKKDIMDNDAMSSSSTLDNSFPTSETTVVQKKYSAEIPSPASDDEKTPTNTPQGSPFVSPQLLPLNPPIVACGDIEFPPVFTSEAPRDSKAACQEEDSLRLPEPLISSSPNSPPSLTPSCPNTDGPKEGKLNELDLNAWMEANSNQKMGSWSDDDDEGTERDEDSNYDSDSGESSVTICSNMSQSDRRSFCLSLADLCNFGGMDYESENDSDEWTCGRRSASLSSDVSAFSCVSVLANDELERLLDDVRGLGDDTLQEYEDVQVVVLHKEMGVGLGFSIAGGLDQNKPVTVHKVFPTGVAAREGSIKEGYQVLSINGTALCGSTHWEALKTLRRARARGMGVVVLRRGGVSGSSSRGRVCAQGETQSHSTEEGQRVCVMLQKQSRDLGFSLEGGVGSSLGDRPLSVQKIFQGGPGDEVFPGDQVLEIEGVSVMGMRRLEAWNLIRSLPPGPVNMVLQRPAIKRPPM